jgi:hypothetical protein
VLHWNIVALAGSWSKQMSDWITSGADAPCSRHEADRYQRARRGKRRRVAWRIGPVAGATSLLLLLSQVVTARDNGQYAATSPELKAWFDSLRSGKGPCCSVSDGTAVSDVDWESNNGHYRVRLEGQWIDVPDEAVITQPNRVGRTMVWPMPGHPVVSVRCFMPGSMS